jgi:hypothetical protein
MSGINTISNSNFSFSITVSVSNPVIGSSNSPISGGTNSKKTQTYGTNIGNTSLGGADEFISLVGTIGTSGSATVNLSSITNILQQTGIGLVRIKAWALRNLSTADDSVNGGNASSLLFGGSAPGQFAFNLSGASAGITVYNGGVQPYFDQQATGFTVTPASNDKIKILNNDASNAAGYEVDLFGGQS